MFKRRYLQRTDYKQRLALLKSGKPRLVVRKGLRHIRVQIIRFEQKGDRTLAEESSKCLKKYGWKAHCGNTPAAYLTGLVLGLKVRKTGVVSAVLDIGVQTSVKGSSLYAAAMGARDAGISIPIGKEIVPSKDRIEGKHTATFAAKLKAEDSARYKSQFASYLRNGLEPEKLAEHFSDVKSIILRELGGANARTAEEKSTEKSEE